MDKDIKNIKYDYKVYLFSLFYKYLYKINIRKNTGVIVQQEWLRVEFEKMFNINNVIVARPVLTSKKVSEPKEFKFNEKKMFIFPSYPRFFKNFEVICEASKFLDEKKIINYEVLLTIDGTENRYTHDLMSKYENLEHVKFVGLLKKEELINLYEKVDCLIFPSKLETWGLPISEFKDSGKPILVSDLPYAHETIGSYRKVNFFNPSNYKKLAELMQDVIENKNNYSESSNIKPQQPYLENWEELLNYILEKQSF